MKMFLFTALGCALSFVSLAQDETNIRKIFDESLSNGASYENLTHLCKDIGHRLSGSENAEKAVEWGFEVLSGMGLDKVYKQEVMVPHWVRGNIEEATIENSARIGTKPMKIFALGGSEGTPKTGIRANVVMVNNFEELEQLGEEGVTGKIVFYNRPMDEKLINTFAAYGGCVDQRWKGAIEAVKYGAVAVLVRSLTHKEDNHPHTGSMGYPEWGERIPAAAVSIEDANALEEVIKAEGTAQVMMKLNCRSMPDVLSHNVIGEITGSVYPDSVILVGGHLDSWDVGEGAHDDGAGVVHSIEVLRLLKAIGYQPRFTIRCVLFMNEENGNRGGKKYAELAKINQEYHYFALESDRGGFTPRGFSIDTKLEQDVQQIAAFKSLLEPYGLHVFEAGYAGVDIGPLKDVQDTITMAGFIPDSQRYFDHHHAETDVLEAVNKRELELGAAAMASLIYLIDKHGLDSRED